MAILFKNKKVNITSSMYYFTLMLLCVKAVFARSAIFPLSGWLDNVMTLFICVLFFFKILTQHYNGRQIITITFLAAVSIVSCFRTGDFTLLLSCLTILSAQEVDLHDAVWVLCSTKTILIIFHVIYYFANLSVMLVWEGGTRGARYFMGFTHPNVFSIIFLWTMLELLFLQYTTIKIPTLCMWYLTILLGYYFTRTRTLLVIASIALLLMILTKYRKSQNRIIYRFSKFSYIICFAVSMLLFGLYAKFSQSLYALNHLLSNRVYYGSLALKVYSPTVFGSAIGSDQTSSLNFLNNAGSLIIDNSYVFFVIKFGLIFVILFAAVFFKLADLNDKKLNIMLILLAVFGLMESSIDNFIICFPLIFASRIIFEDKQARSALGPQQIEPPIQRRSQYLKEQRFHVNT